MFKHLQIRRMHRKRKPPKSREKIDENSPRNEQEVSAAEALLFLAACNAGPNESCQPSENLIKEDQLRQKTGAGQGTNSVEQIDKDVHAFPQEDSQKIDEELFPQEDSKEIDEEQFPQEDSQGRS